MHASRHPCRAFTLIEVLLSLAIAVVLMTMAFTLFRSTNRTLGRQQSEQMQRTPLYQAFVQLDRDLSCTLGGEPGSNLVFRIRADPEHPERTLLSMGSLQALYGEPDLRWAQVGLVRWYLDQGDLIREWLDPSRIDGEPLSRESLCSGLKAFRIEALLDGELVPFWPPEGVEMPPSGVEVELVPSDGSTPLKTRVLIPAGVMVESRA